MFVPKDSKAVIVAALGDVTLAIVMLVPRTDPAWLIAFHRFAEASIGIGVVLLLAWMWPEIEVASS